MRQFLCPDRVNFIIPRRDDDRVETQSRRATELTKVFCSAATRPPLTRLLAWSLRVKGRALRKPLLRLSCGRLYVVKVADLNV
jgi:hypothetical protein